MNSRESSDPTPKERYGQLVELAPSAKYVYKALQRNGTLTQGELAEWTLLPKRTVQYGLDRLKEEGLVEPEVDANDARCRKYSAKEIERAGDDAG